MFLLCDLLPIGRKGGIRLLCIKNYYYALRLVTILAWWRNENKSLLEREQQGVSLPLKEWALLYRVWRAGVRNSKHVVGRTIMVTWIKCQQYLPPVQSPLASFILIRQPAFREAMNIGDFRWWEQTGLDRLGRLGSKAGIIKEEQVIQQMGTFPSVGYHFLNSLARTTCFVG